MKKTARALSLLLLIAGIFLAGAWYGPRGDLKAAAPGARKVQHYVDPMHPTYKSDKPGIAPDCGMELVPVYEDGSTGGAGSSASGLLGAVSIGTEKQQVLGVRVSAVERTAVAHSLRLLGRVVPDETRIYRVNAGIEGFIREVSPVTTGDHVRKDQQLATFSAPNSIQVIQQYILVLGAFDRVKQAVTERSVEAQAGPLANANYQQRASQLQNLGMSPAQMEEIQRTREVPESIKVLAPADGVVLARNVSPDQKFERGAELFRIADLRRVWILADVFENEARSLRPGTTVTVSLPQQKRTFQARVSPVRPQFDPATRTLKVRLEVENPDDILRPDMFVDVELPVNAPPTIAVPVDAVVDSGLRKTVYVAQGDDVFEPRQVETGWRQGDRVEIVTGLAPGERIAVAGTFLLDSESRMRAAAGGAPASHEGHAHAALASGSGAAVARAFANAVDPVCGMSVEVERSSALGHVSQHKGTAYHFCSDDCKSQFDKAPKRFAKLTVSAAR